MKEGPSGSAIRSLIPSHRKLLRSKAVVVSVAETPGRRSLQARLREASASRPSMTCRKRIKRCQNRGMTLPPGSARWMSWSCPVLVDSYGLAIVVAWLGRLMAPSMIAVAWFGPLRSPFLRPGPHGNVAAARRSSQGRPSR